MRIDRLGADGAGVGMGTVGGRSRPVHVRGALPGDVVDVEPDAKGRADTFVLTEPGPDRVAAPCRHHADCGGCDLAELGAERRRTELAALAARQLRFDGDVQMVASPRQTGWRARIKLALHDGVPGYFRHRSHDHVPIEVCGIARPEVQEALDVLRAHDLSDCGETVELRSDGRRVVAHFLGGRRGAVDAVPLPHVALDGKKVRGDVRLELSVAGQTLQASPRSFYQVNLEINALLVAHVVEAAGTFERGLDLYAGIGNLTLPLAAIAPMTAVELEGQATSDLRARAPETVTVQTGRVERFDPSRVAFDLAVLDPPRAGAGGVLPRILRNRPKRVVYVACSIRALARDLAHKAVRQSGYRLLSVRCFEMFPDTHHFETVAVLGR